jgi:hypothetical protein
MRRRIFVVCMALGLFSFVQGQVQNYQLHSVFIYSFTKYVQWPPEKSSGDFIIGVLGDSPIMANLEKMAETRKAGTRDIVIKKMPNISNITACHILFVPDNQRGLVSEVTAKTKSFSTLVVTESDGAIANGSGINFLVRDGKLGFEMNQKAMNDRNLKPANELTRLAIN